MARSSEYNVICASINVIYNTANVRSIHLAWNRNLTTTRNMSQSDWQTRAKFHVFVLVCSFLVGISLHQLIFHSKYQDFCCGLLNIAWTHLYQACVKFTLRVLFQSVIYTARYGRRCVLSVISWPTYCLVFLHWRRSSQVFFLSILDPFLLISWVLVFEKTDWSLREYHQEQFLASEDLDLC